MGGALLLPLSSSSCLACDGATTAAMASASTVRRRRRRRRRSSRSRSRIIPASTTASSLLFLSSLRLAARFGSNINNGSSNVNVNAPLSSSFFLASAGVVTWSNGPEDKFFCGLVWDDPDCAARQNCRSGRDDECEGHETHGIQCFADTNCDTKFGGAAAFVSGKYDVSSPPTPSPAVVDFESLLDAGLFAPTRMPHSPGDPTHIPTEYPIGAPPDFEGYSADPSDHWYCGVGIDDANARCETHCPDSIGCPTGEICYYRTRCDARTHAPTPPPTRRPTVSPTTGRPTVSPKPTERPTISWPPTESPTKQGPTKSPTPSPTGKPTHAPLTEVQGGFFCGTSWSDVTSLCKRRCPSGEDTECPGDEKCFAFTGCNEERGYGPDPSKWVPGHDEWGNSIAEYVAGLKGSEAQDFVDNVAEAVEDDEPLCRQAEVTITADDWPQEITWKIIDLETGNDVVLGDNDELVAGEAVTKQICLPSWACYLFSINDAGGDGLCCEHGEGNYRIRYDGEVVANGAAFYDEESAEFGMCSTEAPTARPTRNRPQNSNVQGGSGSGGGVSVSVGGPFRCVANPLVEAGYEIAAGLCDKFVDCRNEFIDDGDDWFCRDDETCIGAKACGDGGTGSDADVDVDVDVDVDADADAAGALPPKEEAAQPSTPTASRRPTERPTPKPTRRPVTPDPTGTPSEKPTKMPVTESPTFGPTTAAPTEVPTELPTESPTPGPCGGSPCANYDHCRSRYGFCGPGEHYCTETAIWSRDCLTRPTESPESSPAPSASPATLANLGDISPSVNSDDVDSPNPREDHISTPETVPAQAPSFQKPSGGGKGKPSGGKGQPSKPAGGLKPAALKPETTIPAFETGSPTEEPRTIPPMTSHPTREPTPKPAAPGSAAALVSSQLSKTFSPTSLLGSGEDVGYINLSMNSTDAVAITGAPSPGPTPGPTPDPTPRPTKSAAVAAASSTAAAADFVPESEFSCTGSPCEVDTWCRSRYGSCGPGFIYCNTYSMWKLSCPPMAPRPTRKPTPRPTREPADASASFSAWKQPGSLVVAPPAPTEPSVSALPALPKPTLPIITIGTSSNNFSSQAKAVDIYGRPQPGSSEEDHDEYGLHNDDASNEGDNEDDDNEEQSKKIEEDVSSTAVTSEEVYEFGLHQWMDIVEDRSGGASLRTGFGDSLRGAIFIVTSTTSIMSIL